MGSRIRPWLSFSRCAWTLMSNAMPINACCEFRAFHDFTWRLALTKYTHVCRTTWWTNRGTWIFTDIRATVMIRAWCLCTDTLSINTFVIRRAYNKIAFIPTLTRYTHLERFTSYSIAMIYTVTVNTILSCQWAVDTITFVPALPYGFITYPAEQT